MSNEVKHLKPIQRFYYSIFGFIALLFTPVYIWQTVNLFSDSQTLRTFFFFFVPIITIMGLFSLLIFFMGIQVLRDAIRGYSQ